MEAKEAELASVQAALAAQQRAAEQLAVELEQLEKRSPELEQSKAEALEAMNAQYQRIVADPSLDLSEAQEAYRLAVVAQQRHQQAIADKAQEIEGQRGKIEGSRQDAARTEAQLAQLRRGRDAARVTRLERELSRTDSLTITNAVTCDRNDTIAGCIERSEQAARDAALKGFADQVFAATTENGVVAGRRGDDSLALTLEDSHVESGGFRGQGEYVVELKARITSRIAPAEACRLLGIAAAECKDLASRAATEAPAVEGAVASAAVAEPRTAEAAPAAAAAVDDDGTGSYRLTVRSNVYYDEVFIDGISYGSTRLDVMLPPGEYEVEVRKPGYASWRDRVTLDAAVTVIAELTEQ